MHIASLRNHKRCRIVQAVNGGRTTDIVPRIETLTGELLQRYLNKLGDLESELANSAPLWKQSNKRKIALYAT